MSPFSDPWTALLALAELADTAGTPSAGRFGYVRTRGWHVSTTRELAGRTLGPVLTSAITQVDRETWMAADGSGRIEETRSHGQPAPTGVHPAGTLTGLVVWPTTPAELFAAVQRKWGGGERTDQLFTAIQTVWNTQPVRPGVHAAFLRLLAHRPDINLVGPVVDRAGRPGIAVGTSGPYGEHHLIFDQTTGATLASERSGERSSYTLWLESGFVDSVTEVPSAAAMFWPTA